MRRFLFILLLLVTVLNSLFAQGIQYRFSRLDIRDGLSNNQVSNILRDSHGFMWFATSSGLNRYDGYKFKVFKHNISDTTSISNDIVMKVWEGPDNKLWVLTRDLINVYNPDNETFDRNEKTFLSKIGIPDSALDDIKKDRQGYYWFVHTTAGLFKYDQRTGKTIHFTHKENDASTIADNAITAFGENSKGDFWIIHSNGVAEKMDGKTNRIIFRKALLSQYFPQSSDYQLYIDAQDELWCYVTIAPNGALHYDPVQDKLTILNKESGLLNNNIINGITQDNEGLVWICTDHGGVNVYDKKQRTVRYLLNHEDDDKTISQNSITTAYKDSSGIIWAGTYKQGISYYRENIIKFPLYRHQPTNPNSLGYDDVNRFAEDAKGNLWIGTNGGGLIYFNRSTGQFSRFTHSNTNSNTIGNDVIVSLWIDHEQKLWIGSFYGGLDCYDGKTFKHFKHSDADPTGISDDRIWEIYEDSRNRLWIGTLGNGLDMYDREKGMFFHYRGKAINSVSSNYVDAIMEDKQGNIWVGTDAGIDVLDAKTNKFNHIAHADNVKSLSNNFVMCFLQDSRGLMWTGTSEGATLFDEKGNVVKILRTGDGLPDNIILNILEDDNHNIWVSTRNGICKISITGTNEKDYAFHFQNFDEQDGLQGREFNENAALRTRKGELVFGGANGFNLFDPGDIRTNKTVPSIVFTDFLLFNKSIGAGEKVGKNVMLEKAISETKEITLKHNQNVFSIEFAALSFSNTEKNQYMYMLEGFDKDWITTDGRSRKATYTNLGPGTYKFIVKASNDDGVWNEKGITMTIKVLPPFWKTPLAYLLYLLVIAGILYFARYRILQRARARFALEQERHQAQRLHELDLLKIKFLTNVSHEFRTPLSLILTPVEKMIKNSTDSEKPQLQLIHRNAKRLLNLVNQLLDFRKMEVKELKLQTRQGDIIQFIKDIAQSFTDLADKKNITFHINTDAAHFITFFDHDKIERILFNLLSNAFKFTPEHKEITVVLHLNPIMADKATHLLSIEVRDTGIGIEPDKQQKIFERFFQDEIPETLINQGTGIGLAITKEFVKLHGGSISVNSLLEEGSSFVVTLPLKEVVLKPIASLEYVVNKLPEAETSAAETSDAIDKENELPIESKEQYTHSKKPTVLLVEDNDDFRFYLKDNLREHFTILEAENGKAGWQKALANHPEIVVSDISMPVMDGIELCKKIKGDKRTAHMPVILLTALTGEDQQLKGLETGANDYMTKPFNFEILQSRIRNLLALQVKMRKTYQKQVEVKPTDAIIDSPDEKFIAQALEVVEKNISNPDFSVEDLSRAMFMSRVALYKKLLNLSGKSPIDFIRDIRLKRATQLLVQSQMTVAEIAYEVGFNDPKYFTKYFKKEFGVTPSAYAKKA